MGHNLCFIFWGLFGFLSSHVMSKAKRVMGGVGGVGGKSRT